MNQKRLRLHEAELQISLSELINSTLHGPVVGFQRGRFAVEGGVKREKCEVRSE